MPKGGKRMADDTGSTVLRRHLGRALRELRSRAGITLDAAAMASEFSRPKLCRIETGLGAVRGVDVRALCELYRATPALSQALVALAGETRTKGWWHSYGSPVPAWLDLYAGLESTAGRLREYQDTLVPALLQTRGYALGVHQHDPDTTDDERKRRVEARLRRQVLLRRPLPPPPRFDAVLSEAVLLRAVGGAETMAGQLRHLLDVDRLPSVSIRVVPLAAGPHLGMIAGAFVMLDFPTVNRIVPEPPVVYRESLTGALYLDRAAELAAYERVWASLDALALDEEQSRQLINKIVLEVHHG